MEFAIGIVIGIALTLLAFGVGAWLLMRRSVAEPLPEMTTVDGEAAVLVMMIESFLNHQLRAALSSDEFQNAGESAGATGVPPGHPAHHGRSRIDLKLTDAALDVQTGQRGLFYAQLLFTAWNFHVSLRPVADMSFVLHNGRVRIAVTDIQLGGMHVPRALVDRFVGQVVTSAEAKLNHSLQQLQQDTGVYLASIETTEDLMILKFIEPQA